MNIPILVFGFVKNIMTHLYVWYMEWNRNYDLWLINRNKVTEINISSFLAHQFISSSSKYQSCLLREWWFQLPYHSEESLFSWNRGKNGITIFFFCCCKEDSWSSCFVFLSLQETLLFLKNSGKNLNNLLFHYARNLWPSYKRNYCLI